jgi:GIY-YIG catalytic domain/AP2 domain
MITIYLLTDGNGNSYVGQAVNIKQRLRLHKSVCHNDKDKNYNLKIYQIIREVGWEYFTCRSLAETEDQMVADEYEEYFRIGFKANMNTREGGQSGFKVSQETKQKLSEANNKGGCICKVYNGYKFLYYINDERKSKSFSINKYGEEEAYQLALLAREEYLNAMSFKINSTVNVMDNELKP